MSSWKETVQLIAEEAFDEYGNNTEEAENYIFESVNYCEDVIISYYSYQTIFDAQQTDYLTFEEAKNKLGDIKQYEDLDDIIKQLAFNIIYSKAIEYYNHKAEEEKEAIYDA